LLMSLAHSLTFGVKLSIWVTLAFPFGSLLKHQPGEGGLLLRTVWRSVPPSGPRLES
jgi:hypothetical protein